MSLVEALRVNLQVSEYFAKTVCSNFEQQEMSLTNAVPETGKMKMKYFASTRHCLCIVCMHKYSKQLQILADL